MPDFGRCLVYEGMGSLTLNFYLNGKLELVETHFDHRLVPGGKRTVRGKTSGAFHEGAGTFQWTPAVQALALLLLRAKIDHSPISGASGSAAASLDYALSKPPAWLLDMFGVSFSGEPLARKIFRRSNPERRRPGPVCVSLNTAILSPPEIHIAVNGAEVSDPVKLSAYAAALERPAELAGGEYGPRLADVLSGIYRREVGAMLSACDIFNKQRFKKVLRRVNADLHAAGLSRSVPKLSRCFGFQDDVRLRLGLGNAAAGFKRASGTPFTISIAGSTSAPYVLLEYMRRAKGCAFEIDFEYAHAIEIKQKIEARRFANLPEAIVLGLAPAATIVGSPAGQLYEPVMLLPGMSHRMVAQAEIDSTPRRCDFWFLNCEPSTSFLYYERMRRSGMFDGCRLRTHDAEPDAILDALRSHDQDVRAILYFPYFSLNEVYNSCRVIDAPKDEEHVKYNVLFLRTDLAKNQALLSCFEAAVRDAWLELREQRSLRDSIVSDVVSEERYLKFIGRTAGLHQLENHL